MQFKAFAAVTSFVLLGACATMPGREHAGACPPGQTDAQCMHHCPMMDDHGTGDHGMGDQNSAEHAEHQAMHHDMHGQDMAHCPMMEQTPPATAAPDPHH